jgi:O-antigen/teichoic acid export membrane protein
LMQIVFIPFAMWGLVHAVTSIIYGIKEPVFLVKIGAVLIILSIGLNFLLIPRYGAMGAVIATSIPRLIALPLYIRFVSKRIGQPWPIKDGIKIASVSVGTGLIVFLIQYYLGDAIGLGVGIPVGFVIYVAGLLALRLVKPEDMRMLRQLEKRVPAIFRGIFTAALNLVGKFAKE